MQLYCALRCIHSHAVRLAMAEKGLEVELIEVDPAAPPEDLIDLNPYCSTPTLVDRDTVLYDTGVILEYLEERFPHPALMPRDPAERARCRVALRRVESDLYALLPGRGAVLSAAAGRTLLGRVLALTPLLRTRPYFLGDQVSVVDCVLAPLLWRLAPLGVTLPASAEAVRRYLARCVARRAFVETPAAP